MLGRIPLTMDEVPVKMSNKTGTHENRRRKHGEIQKTLEYTTVDKNRMKQRLAELNSNLKTIDSNKHPLLGIEKIL